MPTQVFNGIGNPNGSVTGSPGDLYQERTGQLWINMAFPSTWARLATVDGPWLPVEPAIVPPAPNTDVPVLAGRFNLIGTTNGSQRALFPAAASVANGTALAIKLINYNGGIDLVPDGTDLIDGFPAGVALASFLDTDNAALLAISDGADAWWLRTNKLDE